MNSLEKVEAARRSSSPISCELFVTHVMAAIDRSTGRTQAYRWGRKDFPLQNPHQQHTPSTLEL